jgi:plasmid stabilization system protein ParE
LKILFLRPAEVELREAIDYYNRQSPGLGYEFAAEVKRAIERMKSHPEAWHRLSENTRRCRLNRFPYALVYAVDGKQLLILAVMHLSRHPESWKDRI